MISINIEEIDDVLVEFPARRVSFPEAVWINEELPLTKSFNSYEQFSKEFSYVAHTDQDKCFSVLPLLDTGEVIFKAERYGGQGISTNGGGGRCGNFQGVQIKGIGKNPLVGSTKKFYSYGGLNARDAVYEAIYAAILDKLLPVGVAKIYGVIFTSESGAYNKYDENFPEKEELGWGALLVREICLRPGHFLRAQFFSPRKNINIRLSPDPIRVKRANTSLFQKLGSVEASIDFLKFFLKNCANQFSYTKIFRITHGGIYPSNLCFDGRWIDLTNVSFIGGGENVGGCPPFYEESTSIISFLQEFVDTFSKYNELTLNLKELSDYYNAQLASFFNSHVVSLFSLNNSQLNDSVKNDALGSLSQQVSAVLHSGQKLVLQWPEAIKESDPIISLQEGLFLSLIDTCLGEKKLSSLKCIKGFNSATATSAFSRIVHHVYYANKTPKVLFIDFISLIAISSLKQSIFVEYFYKGRLGSYIKQVIYENPFDARQLIKNSVSVGDWVFESIEEGIVHLYDDKNISLIFNSLDGLFCLHHKNEKIIKNFSSTANFIAEINNCLSEKLIIQGYNFKKSIIKILSIIDLIRK